MFGRARATPGSPPPVAVPPLSAQPTLSEGEVEPVPTVPAMPSSWTSAPAPARKPVRRAQNPHKRRPEAERPRRRARAAKADESRAGAGHLRQGAAARAAIGVAARLSLLLVIGEGWSHTQAARRPPPPAAVEALATAQSDADKDTLA